MFNHVVNGFIIEQLINERITSDSEKSGSYLSHNFLPFLDRHTIDLYIPEVDRTRTVLHLRYLEPDFKLTLSNETITLAYAGSKRPQENRNIVSLVMGIAYEMHDKVMLPVEPGTKAMTKIEKDLIFPLKMRPFGKLWVPIPNHTKTFLNKIRSVHPGVSELAWSVFNNGCSALNRTFPCVVREKGSELLFNGENVLHECFFTK